MPTDPKVNVTVRMSPEELAAIDGHAKSQSRSRSAMIRRMLQYASSVAIDEPLNVPFKAGQ